MLTTGAHLQKEHGLPVSQQQPLQELVGSTFPVIPASQAAMETLTTSNHQLCLTQKKANVFEKYAVLLQTIVYLCYGVCLVTK